MNVTYVSACLDTSGYAEAARNYIGALDKIGVNVDVVPVSFERNRPDLGKLGKLVSSLINKHQQGDIQILHMTPTNFPHFTKKAKYNIGYCTWETDRSEERRVGKECRS